MRKPLAERPSLDSFFAQQAFRTLDAETMTDVMLLTGWLGPAFRTVTGAERAEAAIYASNLLGDLAADRSGYDPSETLCRLFYSGCRGQSPFFSDRFVANERDRVRHFIGRALATPTVDDVLALPERRFTVRFRRSFDVSTASRDRPLRLRIPRPVEDAQLRDLTIDLEGAEELGEPAVRADRIEARLVDRSARSATLGARFRFTAAPGRPTVDGDARGPLETFLRPQEGSVQITPAVRDLAGRIAGAGEGNRDFVRRAWDHLLDRMSCGPVPHDRLGEGAPIDWTIAHGWYDCHLGASLLVSLCRARGIPARLVGGHYLYPGSPTEHFWSEIWLEGEGWTPYDTVCWSLSAGGKDREWRDLFFGATDYRMKTQSFPGHFTGQAGVPLPRRWHRFSRVTDEGLETSTVEIPTGRVVLCDRISVSEG